jgi:hypothetical protein
MKIKQITFVIAAALAAGAAGAATININGTEATGTLDNLSVDSAGNVTITSTGAMTYPGGTTPTPGGSGYTVGGSVTGLPANTSVVLKNNNLDTATVTANGPFTFPTSLSYSSGYSVSVSTQPTGANCAVSNGSGTVNNSDITNVAVACTTSSTPPPPSPGVCGTLPSTVTVGVPVRGKFYDLGSGTMSFPFTVVSGYNNYSASYSSNSPAQKIVWISSCPGATDANGVPAPVGSRFYIQGYQTASLLVSGAATTDVASKQLKVGDQYYFNVRNATTAAPTVSSCSSGNCPFVLAVPN